MSALFAIAALSAQAATAGTTPSSATKPEGQQSQHKGTIAYVDLEGGAGYSTNPNLSVNSSGRGFGRISAHAVYTRISDRTTTALSAFAQDQFYTGRYKSQQSFALDGRHDVAVSEHFRVFGDFALHYDRGGQLDTRVVGLPIVLPPVGSTTPPILFIPSGDFLTFTGRTYAVDGHVGAQWALSSREFLNVSAGLDHSVFKSGSLETRYTTIPLTIGYDRQLSPRATVGARLTAAHTTYSGDTIGTGHTKYDVLTPQVTTQISLSERMVFTGALGASFSSVDDGLRTHHSVGLAGDATLCSRGERSSLCERASIRQEGATAAGPATVMSVGVDYTRRLTANENIAFSLGADRYSHTRFVATAPTFSHATYFHAAAEYSRNIGHRLFAGVNVSGRKVAQTGPDPDADISASAFIRYRFGDLQ